MVDQPRLIPPLRDDSERALIHSDCNRAAWAMLTAPAWPGGALALCGPAKCGKSHFAAVWAARAGAIALPGRADSHLAHEALRAANGRIWFDDMQDGFDEQALLLALDAARAAGGWVLLVGRGRPQEWPAQSPDLISRLRGMPTAALLEPDTQMLRLILRRAARARYLELTEEAVNYLVLRMERSFAAADALAARLDAGLTQAARPVTLPAAKRALAGVLDWSAEGEGEAAVDEAP